MGHWMQINYEERPARTVRAKDEVKGGTRKQGKLLRGPACSSVEEVVDGQV